MDICMPSVRDLIGPLQETKARDKCTHLVGLQLQLCHGLDCRQERRHCSCQLHQHTAELEGYYEFASFEEHRHVALNNIIKLQACDTALSSQYEWLKAQQRPKATGVAATIHSTGRITHHNLFPSYDTVNEVYHAVIALGKSIIVVYDSRQGRVVQEFPLPAVGMLSEDQGGGGHCFYSSLRIFDKWHYLDHTAL